MKSLDHIKLFVLDMDGTIYLGDRLFPETTIFLSHVQQRGKSYCFFTNNSSKNRQAYLEKLEKMGIHIPPEKMLISNDVILKWLDTHHKNQSAYVVGTPALRWDFQRRGIPAEDPNADYVVLGFDTSLTYDKLAKACDLIQKGAPVYGVNPDFNCPVEGGFIPDCGSIAALVQAATGVQCTFFGKPARHTLDYILDFTGCPPQELAIVGDRLYTDIATASGTQVTSILVLSGETQPEDLDESPIRPDLVVENIGALCSYF